MNGATLSFDINIEDVKNILIFYFIIQEFIINTLTVLYFHLQPRAWCSLLSSHVLCFVNQQQRNLFWTLTTNYLPILIAIFVGRFSEKK